MRKLSSDGIEMVSFDGLKIRFTSKEEKQDLLLTQLKIVGESIFIEDMEIDISDHDIKYQFKIPASENAVKAYGKHALNKYMEKMAMYGKRRNFSAVAKYFWKVIKIRYWEIIESGETVKVPAWEEEINIEGDFSPAKMDKKILYFGVEMGDGEYGLFDTQKDAWINAEIFCGETITIFKFLDGEITGEYGIERKDYFEGFEVLIDPDGKWVETNPFDSGVGVSIGFSEDGEISTVEPIEENKRKH